LFANTLLMGDNVVVSRGKDVAMAPRLKIDLTSGMYLFEIESRARVAAATCRSNTAAMNTRILHFPVGTHGFSTTKPTAALGYRQSSARRAGRSRQVHVGLPPGTS
jgi:hypothetical protein